MTESNTSSQQSGRRRRTAGAVLIVAGLLAAAGGLVLLFVPLVYHATATISLAGGSGDAPAPPDPSMVHTELERIRSSSVLSSVVRRFNLASEWGDPLGGSLTRLQAVGRLRDRLTVAPFQDTRLVTIRVRDGDPQVAADLANGIAVAYQQAHREGQHRPVVDDTPALRRNLARQSLVVSNLQQHVNALRVELAATAGTNAPARTRSADEINSYAQAEELARVESELLATETTLSSWAGMNRQQLRTELPAALPNETILPNLLSALDTADQRIANLEPDAPPDDPDLASAIEARDSLEQQIDERISGLLTAMGNRVTALRVERDTLLAAEKKAEATNASPLVDTARKAATYAQLRRDLEAQQKIRDALQLRLTQAEVDMAGSSPMSAVGIVDQAAPPARPDFPNRPLAGGLATLGSLALVTGLVLRRARPPAGA